MSVINYYTAFRNAPVVLVVYACEYNMIEDKIFKGGINENKKNINNCNYVSFSNNT